MFPVWTTGIKSPVVAGIRSPIVAGSKSPVVAGINLFVTTLRCTHHPVGQCGRLPIGKTPETEADHSPLSSVIITNGWSFTSTRLQALVLI
jgi:hypothetical protein